LKVLLLHNYYRHGGGEDVVVRQEKDLLESRGNEVELLAQTNESLVTTWSRANAALNTIYSIASRKLVAARIASFQPHIVHVHNFFPLFSPSVYYACRRAGVPVVQTLHNYRLVCPNAMLLRQGKPCELCLKRKVPWPGALHACYRGSHAASILAASMVGIHRLWRTWEESVNAYVALTQFSREKLINGGLPAERVFLKPNFVFPDPPRTTTMEIRGNAQEDAYALFVGRLAPEKGINTLLAAWKRLSGRKLKIVGTGTLEGTLVPAVGVEFAGHQRAESIWRYMSSARFLIVPSEWYEGFPRVIVEAFASGLPVVASRLGSMTELVEDQRTGVLFRAGDPQDLADKIEWMFTHPAQLQEMSKAARAEFEAKYTAERNYEALMEIYQHASDNARMERSSRGRKFAKSLVPG
jgi:glycosyltransferase involved in cell wall biosynthesis